MQDDRGRAAGDAYVELETRDDMDNAISMHKREMGSRYIKVFETNGLDVKKAKDKQGCSGELWAVVVPGGTQCFERSAMQGNRAREISLTE